MRSELHHWMLAQLRTLLLLLAVLVVVAVLARRLRISASILMVLAGCAMALVPGLPSFALVPELVLLIVLPPVIYSAGVQMSWREFRANLAPIGLLAIGSVVATTCAVAAASHYVLGVDWAVGFVLGAIVAPPDVIAPLAIARPLGIPRRLAVILEGEGLANDGTALVMYRFAVAAVATGAFSLADAVGTFLLILVGEVAYGIAIGWLGLRLRRWAREPRVEITLSLMTPYAAYWLPEHLGGSGVIATITAGLYVSWNGPLLISSATRLQGVFFWDLTIYLIEGLVFLYTGLQVRTILDELHVSDTTQALVATGLTTAVIILTRFACVFPATYLPRAVSRWYRREYPRAPWQLPFFVAFLGVRGVVSLSAALALPLTTSAGAPFPARDLIIVITFGVIVVTLIGQGLLIPGVVRWLGLTTGVAQEHEHEALQEQRARTVTLDAARHRLEDIASEHEIPPDALQFVRARHDEREQLIPSDLTEGLELKRTGARLRMEAIEVERRTLFQLLRDGEITDEARRRLERELDLEEQILGCRRPTE